ncbi:response regulator [Methylobacterium oryzihabitans]|uniref:Response regulator n=1 Tax=Methylobacterium oryzihabitans TaxID=2499852 RepID=A0A3S2VBU4_9HYPH|nr:response regulator [Methylobacterium oryzihabitans]RVU19333.1 response regulator [Methylobacterium oryzihabitans]
MTDPLAVLIAEADGASRQSVAAMVRSDAPGTAVTEVGDGPAFERALAAPPDVIFLDVTLPGLNGASLAEWRRQAGAGKVVVLFSDLLSPHWHTTAARLGVYDVLIKPLTGQQIHNVLAAARVIRRPLNLLVVDPNRATRSVIRRLLDQSHFSFGIVEAESGRRALDLVAGQSFDLAIVDTGLTDCPALEVACQIEARRPGIKLILMGVGLAGQTRRLSAFGVSGVLSKPFQFIDVDQTIHAAFGLWHPYLINALQADRTRRARAVGEPA